MPARTRSAIATAIATATASSRRRSLPRLGALRGIHGNSTSEATPLASQGPYASKLSTRSVLRLNGPDVFNFLQGLVTNDVSKFERASSEKTSTPTVNAAMVYHAPLYTAMLNAQGRVLFDLFLYKPSREEEKLDREGAGPGKGRDEPVLLADVDAGVADEVVDYLKKHILRKKVEVRDISESLAVWQYFGGKLADQPGSSTESEAGSIGWAGGKDESALSSAQTNGGQRRWYKDPRQSTLGLRGLFSSSATPPLIESSTEVEEDYYLLWRLEQGVAEGSVEIPKGEAIPLEYNLAGLNAISFDKGCYVGQELVARTHHRGVIRKRLMPLHFVQTNGEEAQQSVTPGADLVSKRTGKKVGKVTTVLGPRGLGLVRLDSAKAQLIIEKQDGVYVQAGRPKWWPSEWGCEEEAQAQAASNA